MKGKTKILDSATGYDLSAAAYDKKENYLNSFEDSYIFSYLGDLKNKKVLDAGAGTGRLSIKFAALGAEVTALDISPEMLKVLHRKNSRIQTVAADAEDLPFADNSFDVVTGAFLIVHFKNPKYFFNEAYRVLKPGGILLVTNINQKEPPEVATAVGKIKIESYYHRPSEIKEQLEDLAFAVEEHFVSTSEVWVNQILKCVK